MQLLLSLGADPLIENTHGENALIHAVRSRDLDMINIFLNRGVSVSASAATGFSPLHAAAEHWAGSEVVAYLIGAGADVNARIKQPESLAERFHGVTPLMMAAGNLRSEMVWLLLLAGADPAMRSNQGLNAMEIFITIKNELLAEKPTPSEYTQRDLDRIEAALSDPVTGKRRAAEFFQEELVDAVEHNDVTSLVALEAIGLDLKKAFQSQPDLLAEAISEGRDTMARLLLKHGADPLAKDENGRTPFLAAVARGDIELAQFFHQKGADPNDIPWNASLGILQLVYERAKGDRMAMIKWLIGIGADVNWRDEDDNTPLHLAVKNGDLPVCQLLLDSGAYPRYRNEDNKLALDLVPAAQKEAYSRMQSKLWNPGAAQLTQLARLEPALERAKKEQNWVLYQKIAKELMGLGEGKGYYAMGQVHIDGLGVKADEAKAMEYFEQGARIEPVEPDICNAMGMYYAPNDFSSPHLDFDKAVEWYTRGIKAGSLQSAYRLGMLHHYGVGVTKSPQRAFLLIQRAAAQGKRYKRLPYALYQLGYLYEKGIGTTKDPEMAKDLYKEAEELGFVKK